MAAHSLEEVIAKLRVEPRVWVRLAAMYPGDEWRLATLEIVSGDRPPRWQRQRWLYERAAFIASAMRGAVAARWLEKKRVVQRPLSLLLGELGEQAQVERRDSHWPGIFEALPWPVREWKLSVRSDFSHHLHDELVAEGAPAFLNFDRAAADFFGLPAAPNRSFSGSEIVYREQDRRGRIERVEVRPAELVIHVNGDGLSGATITLGGESPPVAKRLSGRSRVVRLPVSDGLPQGAWLALHHDRDLLDRRVFDVWAAQPGVEVHFDTVTRLEVLLAQGEGEHTEFKSELPDGDPRTSMKTIAAFANGNGGSLVFGVDDEGSVVGLQGSTRQIVDRLTNLISDWVHPAPTCQIERSELDGQLVIVVDVARGDEPPYAAGTTRRNLTYYVRRNATTAPATPADVRTVVRSRSEEANDPFASHLRRRR